jgi:hypothetical protein
MTKRYEHQFTFLFKINKCFIISYILFSGCIWIIHSYDNIVSVGLFGYLSCIFLFLGSILTFSLIFNTKEPYIEKVSLLEKIKLLWENKKNIKNILCFIIITMFIRYNFFYITGINISEFTYIPLVSFIVLVTIVPISFSLSVILTIYNGFSLSYGLKYATNKVKESINSSSFLSIIILVITICLVKFLAFPFILPYILSMFPTKQGMLHGNYSAESSTKGGKDPYFDPDSDPEPNKDIDTDNNEDSEPEPNEDIDMDNNEDSDHEPDLISTKWPTEYFRRPDILYNVGFDVYSTYIEPVVKQVALNIRVSDIYAKSNTTLNLYELKSEAGWIYCPATKTWQNGPQKCALINLGKKQAMKESEAKRIASRQLEKDKINNREILRDLDICYLDKYYNAYFNNSRFWIATVASVGATGERAYYTVIDKIVSHYLTQGKGYSVDMQNGETDGIPDGSVTIYDPNSWKGVKDGLGLNGDFKKIWDKNFFHNLFCFIEAKSEHDITTKNTSYINTLKQLKGYHVNSECNINAFSLLFRGFEVSFFMYIHDWHGSNGFFNKASDCNGFICLYVNPVGVQILPQHNTYEPQIIAYNITGDKHDRHAIHTILKWMSMLHGVPKTEKSLVLSELEPSKNPWKHDIKTGFLKEGRVIQTLRYNGLLDVFNSSE